jgi:4-aminobutyrate aminotransferase
MVVWGKGVAGEFPLTGVSVKAEYQSKLEVGGQPATFPGNAVACAVALTNIDIMTDPKLDLPGRAFKVGGEIKAMFQKAAAKSKVMGEVRGQGFYLSVEIVKNKKTKEPADGMKIFGIMTELINHGILNFICGRYGNTFRFMPPLTTPKVYFEKAANTLIEVLAKHEKDLQK